MTLALHTQAMPGTCDTMATAWVFKAIMLTARGFCYYSIRTRGEATVRVEYSHNKSMTTTQQNA